MKTSIIITSYNYGQFIERCVRSCLDQKLIDQAYNEVIVVDDCSSDNTLEIIEKFKKYDNFRIIKNEENSGVAKSANIGIRNSLGRYVVRVDADDYISEHFIFFLQSYLADNHDALGVASDYSLVDMNENYVERRYADKNPISCAIMYRKDRLVQAGLYNDSFRHCEEVELRERMGDEYNVHHLHMPLYRYRMHDSNKTKQEEYGFIKYGFEEKGIKA